MSFLLDTNVISEMARTKPNPGIERWFRHVPGEALYLSVLTLGEIRKGIQQLEASARREKLRVWLESELPVWFEDRILTVDAAVADRWGRLLFEMRRPVAAIDSLLAATAVQHRLRLVTRNTADFEYPGLEVLDPWIS
jgi:predicted nucleic acid-binding protein